MTDELTGPDEPETPPLVPRRCLGMSGGRACLMPPLADSPYCWNHDPARAEDRAASRRLGGQRGNRRGATQPASEGLAVALRDVPAIQGLLEQAVLDVMGLDNSVSRGRTLGYLASLALNALSVGDFENRLAALEKATNVRRSA